MSAAIGSVDGGTLVTGARDERIWLQLLEASK